MSNKVEIELDDLKALVFSSAAIKQIEAALIQRNRDPFVKPYLGLSDAHNRAAAVMRNAERGQMNTRIPWDEPLTDKEVSFLDKVNNYPWHEVDQRVNLLGMTEGGTETAVALIAKGCLQRGTLITGLKWDDQEAADLAPVKDRFVVKLTERGKEKLYEARKPKVETA